MVVLAFHTLWPLPQGFDSKHNINVELWHYYTYIQSISLLTEIKSISHAFLIEF